MNKKTIFFLVGFLVLAAFLLFLITQQESSPTENVRPVADVPGQTETPSGNLDDEIITPNPINLPEGVEPPKFGFNEPEENQTLDEKPDLEEESVSTVINDIFNDDLDTRKELLSNRHIIELDDSSVTGKTIEPETPKPFSVSWLPENRAEFADLVTEYNNPMYLLEIDRPQGQNLYEFVSEVGKKLNLEGKVMRMNENNYSIVDLESGDFLLSYNIFKHTFRATELDIYLGEVNDDPVALFEQFLAESDLPTFETATTGSFTNSENGNTWVTIIPNPAGEIIELKDSAQQGPAKTVIPTTDGIDMIVGTAGTIDAEITPEGRLKQLYMLAPPFEPIREVPVKTETEIIMALEAGEFMFGEAAMQYPGNYGIDERYEFEDALEAKTINVTEGEIYNIACGYLLEPEENLQTILPPVCIGYGVGYINDYPAEFRVLVSIAED
jgi:hypothetical protein